MSDMSTDTTTLATDRECVEIEAKARSSGVMHWPELVRVFNRMRAAEKRVAALEVALTDLLSWFPDEPTEPRWELKAGEYGADEAIDAARAATAPAEEGEYRLVRVVKKERPPIVIDDA